MNPDTNTRTRDEEKAGKPRQTPNTDMQADDAGTQDSGVDANQPAAVDSAMKETSKTDRESGGPR